MNHEWLPALQEVRLASVQVGGRMPLAQARVIQQILLGEGIASELVHGHLPGQHCRLFVDEAVAPIAEVFLAASDVDTHTETVCPSCGETNPGTFAECWNCHADLAGDAPPRTVPAPIPAVTSHPAALAVSGWWFVAALLLVTSLVWMFRANSMGPDGTVAAAEGRCIVEYWANDAITGAYCDAADAAEHHHAGTMPHQTHAGRGDGWFESYTRLLRAGRRVEWHDRDGDTFFEERRVLDANGTLLTVERHTPEGFRRQP